MPRWPSPDPNSWAKCRGRKKGKGTTTKARQARRAVSPRVLAKREKRAEEGPASSADPLQQGEPQQAATRVANPLQQGEAQQAATGVANPLQQGETQQAATAVANPLQQGEAQQAAPQAAQPLQQGGTQQAATQAAQPLQQGEAKKEATQAAEPLQQGEKHKATAVAQPLQQGEQQQPTKDEPLQEGENKAQNKEERWETALGKRARSLQRRKASKERQWQVKVGPLPEGKVAEPLEEGPKAKGRPASSAAGRRKTGSGYVGLGSDSSSTQPSPSPSTSSSVPPLRKGTPATPREEGSLHKGKGGRKGKPLEQGQVDLQPNSRGKPLKQGKKVLCLDWHNVFQIQMGGKDCVPDGRIQKVWDLQAENWEIHILSYAGKKMAQEVKAWAWSLPVKWASVNCCSERTGKWGKTAWAKWLGCSVVMDDNKDICQEALEEGLEVLPITTQHQRHVWYWGKPFDSFPQAVDHLLMMDR